MMLTNDAFDRRMAEIHAADEVRRKCQPEGTLCDQHKAVLQDLLKHNDVLVRQPWRSSRLNWEFKVTAVKHEMDDGTINTLYDYGWIEWDAPRNGYRASDKARKEFA